MRIPVFLSMIRRDEYDPKRHRLVDLPSTGTEELLQYYRGTAAAVSLIAHDIITTHDLVRVEPALELAHAELVRRMMGRPPAGAPDGYMADLLFVQEDLRIPDLSVPLVTKPAQVPILTMSEIPAPSAKTPRPALAGITNEELMEMEALQVARIMEIWGNSVRLDPEKAEQAREASHALSLIREEMSARFIQQPTRAHREEQMFRQRIAKAQQSQRNRSRGRDQGM